MQLPQEVQSVLKKLQSAGFEAYAVGGCVRDVLLKKEPADWDVATSAKPEEIQRVFPKSFYANRFGTVTILTGSADHNLKEIEVTTYRTDASYSDKRHPDEVKFTSEIKDDLSRRDFTINAMALNSIGLGASPKQAKHEIIIDEMRIIDPFGGLKDLDQRVIRAVSEPKERFNEDALRLLRAVRLAAQLDFEIEKETLREITAQAHLIQAVSQERIRDELVKIVMSDQPEKGMTLLKETGLLKIILPELAEGVGVEQNKHHIYTVFVHSVKSLQYAANYDYPLHIRLAALLHDIGKPRTRRWSPSAPTPATGGATGDKKGGDYTFYGHDIVGARMAEKLLKRLRFSNELVKIVRHLIRYHMFYYDVGKITEAGVRRLLQRVGREHFDDLIKLRVAERKGSGVPKARPYRLRHLQFMAEKVARQPISTSQLVISGNDLIQELKMKPGPIFGGILNALLAEVIEDPSKNTREYLLKRAGELKDKDPADLKKLGQLATEQEEKKWEDEIRRKYHV